MSNLRHSDSILIDTTPEKLYALISDVTRTGEWSPICTGCWWDEGQGPEVGAWFTGRNETPQRTWETRSEVVVADPGREFAWKVGGKYSRWGYTLDAAEGGTRLTESWHFTDEGIVYFHEKYADDAQAQIENRIEVAHTGIPETLARIKQIAERG